MSTWLNRGASGGLAGARRHKENQPTANSPNRLTHRNPDAPASARLESPGLFFSGLPGVLLGPSDRSDIFSNAIASSQVTSGGHFHGVLTLDSALPSANQTFYFSLNYLRPGAVVLSDNVLVGLSNLSAGRAVALGLTGGLYLFEGHINYGPPPTIATVTETAFVLLSAPASIGPVQLDIDYEEVAGSGTFTVGYRLSPSGPFASPLAPIASTLVAGFWDIGTAQAVPAGAGGCKPVPAGPSLYVCLPGVAGSGG